MFNQISKSGTNAWHGSGYEFFSQNFLNANTYFGDQQPKLTTNPLNPTGPQIPNPAAQVPYLRYDQFGASVGGPIIKNKLFFFFDIDRIVNNTVYNNGTNNFATVPTAAMEQGDFTGMQPMYDPLSTTSSLAVHGSVQVQRSSCSHHFLRRMRRPQHDSERHQLRRYTQPDRPRVGGHYGF